RRRCVHLRLRPRDRGRRAPARLPRPRAARDRRGPRRRRPQRLAPRHRREVRRRRLARGGGRRRRPGASSVVTANATTFTFDTAPVVFGAGSSAEAGQHLALLGVTRALVVCDPFVTASGLGERLEASLRDAGVETVAYDRILGEPSEESVAEAIAAARDGFDGFVGVGGGSALDTAKLCPLVALPTTSGTGSEVTTVAVVDFPRLGTKTGISHRHLRPALALVDPLL